MKYALDDLKPEVKAKSEQYGKELHKLINCTFYYQSKANP